jgi:predicted nucleic acid-binding Zn ribbon protein
MKECPSCKEKHDDSTSVCLFCGSDIARKSFPRKKALIILFSLFFILIIPVVLLAVYLTVFTDLGTSLRRTEDKQIREAIITDEEEEEKPEEKK